MSAISMLLGAGFGLSLWVMFLGWRGVTFQLPRRSGRRRLTEAERRALILRVAGAVIAAVVVGLITRWPVGAVLAGAAAWWLPGLLGRDQNYAREVARIEAVAGWTEQLRDTLAAASGLEQAIRATASTAPAAIRDHVVRLDVDLDTGSQLSPALRDFAERLADPTADLVIAALIQATQAQARDLAALLGALAHSARAQAGMRMRVASGRARTRTSARMITGVTLSIAVALVLLNRPYLEPYGTPTGQAVLLLVGAIFAIAFTWLSRASRISKPQRFLAPQPTDRSMTGDKP
jgi:Flp pilus assembly protein TadB